MRRFAALSPFLVLLVADPAHACSCVPIDPRQAFERADAVFEGRVLEIERATDPTSPIRVTLAVVQHWKGIDTERAVLETSAGGTAACGVPFEVHTSWLVYAAREGGALTASLCSRTSRIEDAREDLAALGAGVVPVEVGPEDEVERRAPDEPPARGGCASCSAAGMRSGHDGRSAWLLAFALLLVKRSRARCEVGRDGRATAGP